MRYAATQYRELQSVCIQKYGGVKGNSIYGKAEELFQNMQDDADYRGSAVIRDHMDNNIFPVLAYYMALLEHGFSKEEAYAHTLEESQKIARAYREKNKKIGKMPFSYALFKLVCKRILAKNYPDEGWETEWVRFDRREIHFNYSRCVYFDVVSQYGHPELCTVFCANDTTSFAGYLPHIRFERSGTIGEGKALCDFNFKNGRYKD